MPLHFANYSLHRALPIGWRWTADLEGTETRSGYCLSKRAASQEAQRWLRRRREALDRAFAGAPQVSRAVEFRPVQRRYYRLG